MKPEQIRAIALEVARELLDEPLNIGQAEHYTDFATRFLSAITEQAEPVGYIDAEQLRRWDVLRGTKFESEERCYMPFSKTLYQTGLSDCSLPVFTHPPFEQERCASVSAKSVGAAPLPDCVVVPKSRYKELTDCLEAMATGKGGWAWEDVLDEHRAMIAAGEVK